MKKAMKKLLCVVLVLMIAIPFAAFPASAEASAQADTLEPLYEVDFRGNDGTLGAFTKGWKAKMKSTASSDGKSIVIEKSDTSTSSNRYVKSTVSATLSTETFSLLDNAYTMVFTLTPENDLQEIGLLLDHCNGFIITPASNGYRFVEATGGEGVNDNTWPSDNEYYEGEKTLTNTYAVEIATEGEKGNAGDKNWEFTAYNLYCLADDGEWVCLYELSDEELADVAWDFGWYEEDGADLFDEDFCIRFYRNRTSKNSALDKANNAQMTVSNMSIYGGLAASSGALNVETRAYYLASDGDLLYTANFNGGDGKITPYEGNWEGWAGMTTSDVILGGKAIELKPNKNNSNEASTWRAIMDTTNYPVKGNSYTMAFTVTASDKDQEIGLYPDWSSGFVVVPGKNQFKYNQTPSPRTSNNTIVDYTEYEGTYSLTQTYAVEFKLNEDSFSVAEYNLYVAQDGKWVLLYSLNATELATGPCWSNIDYELMIGFYRDSKIANQTSGTVTVSDFKVYKGLAAKSGAAVAPANAVYYSYDDAAYGDLIYVPDFNGDAVLSDLKAGWTGMHSSFNVAADGKTVTIKSTWSDSGKGGVWGAKLNGYGMLGNSYTTVFTVTASDDNEEIGFLPDHWAGFAVNPGQNTYRFINTNGADGTDEEIASGTYVGNGALTQTYAIEIKSEGTSLEDMNLTAYNLYVARNGEWQLVRAFTAAELDEITFDWGAAMDNDNDFVVRLYQLRDDNNDNNIMRISNYALYKGLGATIGAIPAEFNAVSYENAKDGDLLYNVNFEGDSIFSGKDGWAGMDEKNKTATSVDLYTKKDDDGASPWRNNVWGADLKGYAILGKSFTTVFTVTASDADQEVGFLPCDWAGFVVTPGKNAYRFITTKNSGGTDGAYENVIVSGTYNGTGALTQNYAVEFASDADGECLTAYNLYVLMDGVWVLVCELDANQMDISYFDWFYEYEEGGETLYEEDFTVRFYRSYYVRGEDGWATEEVGNQTGKITISDMKIYRGNDILPEVGLINGASVRLDDPTGIRFTGSITKEYYNELSKDDKVVTLGVLIAPTDYIFDNQIAFTKEAFDAARVQYLTIDGTLREEATYYKVNCAMVNMNEGNYERDFSARLYVAVDGKIVAYSAYSHANNSRSIATVAERAYNDVSTTQNGAYKNAITIGDIAVSYSPYTAEERAILGTFFDVEDPTPDSSISVMTYNIKGTSSDRETKRDITKAYSFIANSGVDVIGLQEDDDYNASAILALNSDYALVSGSNNGNGNEDNAILYNTTKFKVVNSGGSVYFKKLVDTKDVYQQVLNITVTGKEYIDTDSDGKVDTAAGEEVTVSPNFDYDQMGDEEGWLWNKEDKGRFFRWVVLEDLETGVQYIVVNTHLHYRKTSTASDKDSNASSPNNKAVRQAQAMLIKLWLENDDTAKNYANAIVMGDLNGQHDSNVLKSLTDNGALRQARNTAVMIGDDWGTLVGAEDYMERQKWIFDHVVYNSDALVAAKFTVVDNKLTGADAAKANYPSDHLPVAAEFYYYN